LDRAAAPQQGQPEAGAHDGLAAGGAVHHLRSQIMAAPEFSFPACALDAGGKHVCFPVRASWLRGVLEGTDVQPGGGDGELDLRLSKSGADVVVRGTVTAEVSVSCARCLQPARFVVREPLSALVVLAGGVAAPHRPGDKADEADEKSGALDQADVIPYDGETVVLDDLVRDEVLLGIPMIPLCSETCPGIRPEAPPESALSGIDPRLRPLLRLKKSPM
jgi:uncharacterized protein